MDIPVSKIVGPVGNSVKKKTKFKRVLTRTISTEEATEAMVSKTSRNTNATVTDAGGVVAEIRLSRAWKRMKNIASDIVDKKEVSSKKKDESMDTESKMRRSNIRMEEAAVSRNTESRMRRRSTVDNIAENTTTGSKTRTISIDMNAMENRTRRINTETGSRMRRTDISMGDVEHMNDVGSMAKMRTTLGSIIGTNTLAINKMECCKDSQLRPKKIGTATTATEEISRTTAGEAPLAGELTMDAIMNGRADTKRRSASSGCGM
mmetsp:Transcript_53957/g.89011  ORF Transcript_53957/g.89011 Transcript_53957/m.89011 type:complete len:263 (-) Transcript_53957:1480-2268(-)